MLPDEPATTIARLREVESPDRLLVLAEAAGEVVGSGIADRSSLADAFVAPRILPVHLRKGAGTAVLLALLRHIQSRGYRSVAAAVVDNASYDFAIHHGFAEVDRQVEQVRSIVPGEPAGPSYVGVEFTTVADDPDLLRRAYGIAKEGYKDFALKAGSVEVSLEEWLRDEATMPAGSIVALADGEVIGYAGLTAWNDDETRAENGLTVVERTWRGRGLGTAMKRHQLAWAAANGLREIVTWTQEGNEAMRHVNAGLGYVTRSVSRTMRRDMP